MPEESGEVRWDDREVEKINREMADMRTVDELLEKAEEYVPNADPFLLIGSVSDKQFHTTAELFIKEAWRRIKNMAPGPEYDRLVEKASKVQKDFHGMELKFFE